MILTGKARKDFSDWYTSTNSIDILEGEYSEEVFRIMRNALIIHWFDTVGLKIQYIREYNMIESAIIEANNLYNEHIKK